MKGVSLAFLSILIILGPMTLYAGDCGDVNNSGGINILDITYLINYLYKGGPQPDCGPETGTMIDIEGNTYLTVKIWNQWWMAENLKVTHYRNGDPTPNVTDPGEWSGLTTGAYCEYNNDNANVDVYGRLYNWYAVNDSRNIAPEGWHVPTDAEWKQLEMYLGMSQSEADATGLRGTDEGGKLKETGITHWDSPNTGATNESGFAALPGGLRSIDGGFNVMGKYADFWSSTEGSNIYAWNRHLLYDNSQIYRNYYRKQNGFSVRCVKD